MGVSPPTIEDKDDRFRTDVHMAWLAVSGIRSYLGVLALRNRASD